MTTPIEYIIPEVRRSATCGLMGRISPADVLAILSALKKAQEGRDAAQSDALEQARLVGMGAERELRLMAERDEARLWDERSRAANMEAVRALGDWLLVPPDGGAQTLAEGVQALTARCDALADALKGAVVALEMGREQLQTELEEIGIDEDPVLSAFVAALAKANAAVERKNPPTPIKAGGSE